MADKPTAVSNALVPISPNSAILTRNIAHLLEDTRLPASPKISEKATKPPQSLTPAQWRYPATITGVEPALVVEIKRVVPLPPRSPTMTAHDRFGGDPTPSVILSRHRCKVAVEVRVPPVQPEHGSALLLQDCQAATIHIGQKGDKSTTDFSTDKAFEFPLSKLLSAGSTSPQLVFKVFPEDVTRVDGWQSIFGMERGRDRGMTSQTAIAKHSTLRKTPSWGVLLPLSYRFEGRVVPSRAGLHISLKWKAYSKSVLAMHNHTLLSKLNPARVDAQNLRGKRKNVRIKYVWGHDAETYELDMEKQIECPLCFAGEHRDLYVLLFHLRIKHSEFSFVLEEDHSSEDCVRATFKVTEKLGGKRKRVPDRRELIAHLSAENPEAKRRRKDRAWYETRGARAHRSRSPEHSASGVDLTESPAYGRRSLRLNGLTKRQQGVIEEHHNDQADERDLSRQVSVPSFERHATRTGKSNGILRAATTSSKSRSLEHRVDDEHWRSGADKGPARRKSSHASNAIPPSGRDLIRSQSAQVNGAHRELLSDYSTSPETSPDHARDLEARSLPVDDNLAGPVVVNGDTTLSSRLKYRVPAAPEGVSFFRTVSKRPLEEGECLSESDDELNETWLLLKHNEALDSFDDVTKRERDFIKLYDAHFHAERITGHRFFGRAFRKFVKKNRHVLTKDAMFSETCKKAASLCAANILDVGSAKSTIDILLRARRDAEQQVGNGKTST